MHKDWCGKNCSNCKHPCKLDSELYCDPSCKNLGANGEMDSEECKTCDAYLAMLEDKGELKRCTESH